MLRRFLQGQAPSTSGPKRPFAPRDRRRDDRLGPGSTKRAFEKTTYSVILCILHPGLLSVDSARLLRERSGPAVRPQIIPPTARGDAVAATCVYVVEAARGDAAAATWIFRGACAAAPARPRVRRDPAGNPRSTPRRRRDMFSDDPRIGSSPRARRPNPTDDPHNALAGVAATCPRTR